MDRLLQEANAAGLHAGELSPDICNGHERAAYQPFSQVGRASISLVFQGVRAEGPNECFINCCGEPRDHRDITLIPHHLGVELPQIAKNSAQPFNAQFYLLVRQIGGSSISHD
jgi:hypothetical protein